jgi:uncharacterized protein YacL
VSGTAARFAVRAAVAALVLAAGAGVAGRLPLAPVLAAATVLAAALAGEAFLTARGCAAAVPAPPRTGGAALLDTSVLIDGRIADVCATGFVAFELIVPEFVLRELQHVADAPDPGRRARGRRGLDILNALRTSDRVRLAIVPDDVPDEREVDAKLVALAVRRGAALVTTDFNLNKVAAVRGVAVLNVNDLAHALRPAMLPGETLEVTIVKEGKEPGQGVAYLDDGTMVVVDQARSLQGKTVAIVVTSAIQTAAGKMFFARLSD